MTAILSGGNGTLADGSVTIPKLAFDPATQTELDAVSNTAVVASGSGGALPWAASTAFAKNQIVSNNGGYYLCTTAHTSSSTFDASKFTALAVSAVASLLGQTGGAVVSPAALPPGLGGELWVVANFIAGAGRNGSTLTPSLTANSTNQTLDTIVHLNNISQADWGYRVKLAVNSVPANGWYGVSLAIVDNAGTILTNSAEQWVFGYNSPDQAPLIMFDFKPNKTWAAAGSTFNLRIRLTTSGNSTSGSLAINNVSVQQVAFAQRPLYYAFVPSIGPSVMQRVYDPVAKAFRLVQTVIQAENTLTSSPQTIYGWPREFPFGIAQADPDFISTATAMATGVGNSSQAGLTDFRLMRANNNDQIIEVQDSNGNWQLRGNTHGGESDRAGSPIFQYDLGDGAWNAWSSGAAPANTGANNGLKPCRRFQLIFNTKISRTVGADDVANVDHKVTYFPDGMLRMDRTTTWLKASQVRLVFEWMTSHDLGTPKIGRIGTGLLVLDNVDIFPKVAVPAAPTVTAGGSGSSLGAGTYSYVVTALADGGETSASGRTAATLTAAQTATVAWSTVSGAQGYRVYGRANVPGALTLLATVGPGVTSFIDDGTAPQLGATFPPAYNRARKLTSNAVEQDTATSDKAVWGVWYDPIVNLCFGNIYDRDAIAGRTRVGGSQMRLEGIPGSIVKNYLNLYWASGPDTTDVYPADAGPARTRLVPLGEVWTATHWSFAYAPADPVNYHLEIAARSVDLTALKSMYPAA